MKTIFKRLQLIHTGTFHWIKLLVFVFSCMICAAPEVQAQAFSDDFTRGTDPGPLAPWVAQAGAWTVAGGAMQAGVNPQQTYAFAYITSSWTNYSVQAQIRFSTTGAWGGGIGGRLNPTTGAHYAAWVYPEASAGGSNVLRLIKFQSYSSFGYTNTSFAVMQTANLPAVGTNYHSVKLAFLGNQITVSYDGTQVINTTDVEAQPYTSGAVSLDFWTDLITYNFFVDNVQVLLVSAVPVANNDSYNATLGTTLTVAAPGVLSNDTSGGGTLTAVRLSNPAHGNLTFNTNGGFSYTPTNNFTGTDAFNYQASDGVTNSTAATVTLTISPDHPPVANNDSYAMLGNTVLTVGAPGVLVNDTDVDGNNLTAVLVSGPTNGTLNLTNNGSFGYTPTNGFAGADSFVYRATDGVSNSAPATVSISVLPAGMLFFDNFARGTDPGPLSPWVAQAGGWTVTGGVLQDGVEPVQNYAFATMTTNSWDNFSVQGRIQFSSTNGWGGGLGGRLNGATGAHYGAWVYPEASAGGSNVLRLIKFQTYTSFSYNGVGGATMRTVSLPSVGTNAHTLKLAFQGSQIAVAYDGTQVISMADAEAQPYVNGGISVERWTDLITYTMSVDDVIVSSLAIDDSYSVNQNATLTVPAPGVLANDTEVYGTNLSAVVVSGPSHGTVNLSTNGGFIYTPTPGYNGPDSFGYQANDGVTNVGTATVTITVNALSGPILVFAENFDGVTKPALPSGWTTSKTGAESNWFTTNSTVDTAPNSVFVPDPAGVGNSELISPSIPLPAGPNQLNFRHFYDLETGTTAAVGFDGGVLEININGGAFTDIMAAGGSFITGGYNRVIDPGFQNPLINRAAWSGNSSNFVTATVNLPPSASGQSIQLKWRCGTDTTTAKNGWRVDTISITNCVSSTCWNTAPVLPSQTNVTANELALLTIVNTATDTDVPANALTYSLLSSPPGSSINSSGVITWTPAEAQGPGIYTFTTRVADNGTPILSATNSFTVTVNEVNLAPVLPGQVNRTNNGLATLSVTNTATDSDVPANSLAYTLLAAPASATISATGVISWTPVAAQIPSTNIFTTRVVDSGSPALSATNTFAVVAAAVHNGPSFSAQANRTNSELTLITVNNTAIDMDVPVLTLAYQLLSAPAGASIDANGVITWTPTEAQGPSTNTITARVSDNGSPNLSATNSFTVIVNEVNSAPVLPAQTNRTIAELTPLSVTNTASDSDLPTNTLTYQLLSPPAGVSVDTNGVITWTPTEAQGPGTNLITMKVTDNGVPPLSATNSFTVIVNEVNSAPVLPLQTNRTVNELATLTVTNTATDQDLPTNILTYQLVASPAGATIGTNGIITWTPTEAQGPGTHLITTIVTDNGVPPLSATNSFTVIVNEVNSAPVLPAQTNRTIAELTPLSVTNTASDSDLPTNTLTYQLLSPPAGVSVDTNGVITWTPTEAQGPGTNLITMKVTDNGVPPLSATNSFTVIVNEANSAPVLPVQTNRTIAELSSLSVTNTASDSDLPANLLTYQLVTPPAGMSIGTNGVITWTPSEAQGPGTHLITTVVTDNGVPPLSATNSFTIIVNEVNSAPVLPVQTNRAIAELTALTVTNLASDTDVPANLLTYQVIGPVGATIDTNGVITWTPGEAQGPSTNLITTVVMDNGVPPLSATNAFTVIVNEVNSAPVLPVQTSRTVNELVTLTVTNSATDSDLPANQLSYQLVGPSGATIDTNGVITWTPTEAQGPGTNLITTLVTDNGVPPLSTTNSFTVIVNEVNSAPVLPVQINLAIAELTTLTVTNTASDSDLPANLLSYQLVGPSGATIDTNGVITWTPTEAQGPGTNLITTIVTDNGVPPLSATNSFTVIVNEVNSAPVLPVQTSLVIAELAILTVTNTASDSDLPANLLSYQLVGPSGATIDTNGVITWTPTEAQGPGTNLITTVVTDNGVPPLSATNSFTVIVNEVNSAPVLAVQTNRTINELTLLTVTNTAADSDLPADLLTFQLVSPPAGMTIDSNGVITWTPTEAQGPSTNLITTIVTDNGVPPLSATNSFTLIVNEVNSAPVLPVQTNQTVNELALLTVINTATDADLPANLLSYQLVAPPVGATIDADGIITWTPTAGLGASTNTLTTVVTDDGVPPLSATNVFLVVVNGTQDVPAPVILSFSISSGIATITWSSVASHSYRLQYSSDLNSTNWTDQLPEVLATGSTATATNEFGISEQRFYRILPVP